jgi:hypothetical protein
VSANLHILQHSLGVDQYGRGRRYRNHFCTGPGSTDWNDCNALVADGLMVRRDGSALTGGDYLFTVTDAGQRHVTEHSPAPPKLTRSKQRYQDYLDADTGLSFREWIGTAR